MPQDSDDLWCTCGSKCRVRWFLIIVFFGCCLFISGIGLFFSRGDLVDQDTNFQVGVVCIVVGFIIAVAFAPFLCCALFGCCDFLDRCDCCCGEDEEAPQGRDRNDVGRISVSVPND